MAAFVLLGLPPLLALIWLIWRPPPLPPTPWPTAPITLVRTPPSLSPAPATITPASPAATATEVAFHVGMRVLVSGTEGSGLNLRAAPSLQAETLFIAPEGFHLRLLQGPLKVDGYRWWRVEQVGNPDLVGWVVERYLQAAP